MRIRIGVNVGVLLLLREKKFTTRGPSTSTRHCSVRLSPIAENSPLLPPVGVWASFPAVVPLPRAGSYALLTRPPLETPLLVRLACVKHAASVHPEPGSNSP
ncbi:hypothetical protein PVK06_005386 [Gossypium arboreum]|uniref:Uncharacterized protein n=1 Tax=Gossypium arboreum TaxID=29729 RepID=A0ABR0QVR3_GOSAR|nr:hypothetical protein PVK06_005386 [Gossypium arboreum]